MVRLALHARLFGNMQANETHDSEFSTSYGFHTNSNRVSCFDCFGNAGFEKLPVFLLHDSDEKVCTCTLSTRSLKLLYELSLLLQLATIYLESIDPKIINCINYLCRTLARHDALPHRTRILSNTRLSTASHRHCALVLNRVLHHDCNYGFNCQVQAGIEISVLAPHAGRALESRV